MTRWGGPGAAFARQAKELHAAVDRVLDSGWYVLGPEVEAFEEEFAAWTGSAYSLGVANGTDALVVALRAAGVGPGDVVATVSHTAVATVAAIELTGATPLLVDIDAVSMTMCPLSLAAALEAHAGHVRAVVPVHLYGHPADMPEILRIAGEHGAVVVEDCAQAHGAALDGRPVGSWGVAAAYSFYPTKNLGALGDAGALTTSDTELAHRARLLRQYGWVERYISEVPGLNSRLDPVQAAVLRVRLPGLRDDNARRRQIAQRYDDALADLVRVPATAPGADHVYHQYTVRLPRRDEVAEQMRQAGVPVAVLYPQAVHQQPAYAGRVPVSPTGLRVTEDTVEQLLCLPVNPDVDDDAVDAAIDALQKAAHGL